MDNRPILFEQSLYTYRDHTLLGLRDLFTITSRKKAAFIKAGSDLIGGRLRPQSLLPHTSDTPSVIRHRRLTVAEVEEALGIGPLRSLAPRLHTHTHTQTHTTNGGATQLEFLTKTGTPYTHTYTHSALGNRIMLSCREYQAMNEGMRHHSSRKYFS